MLKIVTLLIVVALPISGLSVEEKFHSPWGLTKDERSKYTTGLGVGWFTYDGTGKILAKKSVGNAVEYEISIAPELSRHLITKGSVAVDGISLTVTNRDYDSFEVSIVSSTLENTILSNRRVGDTVNIEVDIIAKYVEQLTIEDVAEDFIRDLYERYLAGEDLNITEEVEEPEENVTEEVNVTEELNVTEINIIISLIDKGMFIIIHFF